MLVVETIARIRRDHLVRGVPIKKIARDLRVSKNTVRKVVRGDETSYSYERKIQPMPKLGPWVDELERQLEANEKKPRRDRLSLLRVHEDLAALTAKDAVTGAEALFGMGFGAQDDVDQDPGMGPVGGGPASDAFRGPIGK